MANHILLLRVNKTARIASYILHPSIIMVLTVIVYALQINASSGTILTYTAILIAGLFPGLFYIFWRKRRGEISDYHLVLKEERRIVLPLLLAGLAGALALYLILGAPRMMIEGLVIALVGGGIIAIITWFWKISFHAAVAAGCSALFLPISPIAMIVIGGLAILSGLARLPIKHHTVAEVAGGWVYGFGVTTVLIWLLTDYL